jgi:hypothetical protein
LFAVVETAVCLKVNILLSFAVLTAAVVGAIAALLLVRRRAPRGGYFSDSERAAGIFGFLGTTFSVLLAFVIFLALETYTNARSEAAHEADAVLEQFEIAQLFSNDDKEALQGMIICYGRSVIADEWRLMRDGRRSALVSGWVLAIEHRIDAAQVEGIRQGTGFEKFFEETIEREDGRRGRLQEASGVVPSPMWLMLILGAACLFTHLLLFADSGERVLVQTTQIGTVTALLVASLLLVNFLDHPYRRGPGSINPTSMQSAVTTMEHEVGGRTIADCDNEGRPQ